MSVFLSNKRAAETTGLKTKQYRFLKQNETYYVKSSNWAP